MFRNIHNDIDNVLSQFPLIGGRFAVYFAEGDGGDGAGGDGAGEGAGSGDAGNAGAGSAGGDGASGGGSAGGEDWKAKYDSEVTNAVSARKRAQAAEAERDALKNGALTPEQREEYLKLKADEAKAEEERLRKDGEFDDLLAQKQVKSDEEKATIAAERDAALAAFQLVAVQGPMHAELASVGVKDVKAAAHLIQNMYKAKAIATLVDGVAVVKVVNSDGTPKTDADCQPGETITVEKLVLEWIATDTGKNFMPPSGDTGSGAHKGGVAGVTIEDLDADVNKKAAFIQEHGTKEYIALAAKKKKKT